MQDLENHAYQFQSTPSQGATDLPEGIANVLDISIHAPLTGSDRTLFDFKYPWYNISIHAPLTGSDDATNLLNQIINISIHAPLTGSDEKSDVIICRIP